jgi:hypothetical protein
MTTSYPTSIDYGKAYGMGEIRKITVQVADRDLKAAQEFTGAGVSETVRAGLKKLASIRAQQRLLGLQGKVKFSMTLEDLRYDRE